MFFIAAMWNDKMQTVTGLTCGLHGQQLERHALPSGIPG